MDGLRNINHFAEGTNLPRLTAEGDRAPYLQSNPDISWLGECMKISDVDVIILESPGRIIVGHRRRRRGAWNQVPGPRQSGNGCRLLVGYADLETQPHVARTIVNAPL